MSSARLNILVADAKLDRALLERLLSLELFESDEGEATLSLRFRLTSERGGEWRPLDDEPFAPAARVAVDLAAPGGPPRRVFVGHLSHVRPHFEQRVDGCYVEVVAADAGALMDVEDVARAWPDRSDAEVARELFAAWSLAATVVDTPIRHASDRRLLVQRETDWRFARRLAQRNGYLCWIEADPRDGRAHAHFGPPRVDAEPQAALALHPRAGNLRWIDMQQRCLTRVRARGLSFDPLAKELVHARPGAPLPSMGAEHAAALAERGMRAEGVERAEGWLREADASTTSERVGALVEARGELDPAAYGDLLRAHRPVLVMGVGRRFGGRWWVREVHTSYRRGGLSQTFRLWRNALGVGADEDLAGRPRDTVDPPRARQVVR